ncbi:flagellar basal body-associated protein FliL [Pseudotabrizicola sediminis]|uniref:Flagellar basal body-associated protein FliL n=1 Tax=Pseudotabrizicola sediminis TaxID=2486418 RepID=A0ABY2KM38_9RHOB|nr:flagellar basal body-associated FliL family protein [Pseudotabrizicola sediminis]TGD41952.1 flagellar basal body-associated protein FliL [Pseudotabrizicola sediminis]
MRKLLPLLLIMIGAGAGLGAGLYLRPAPPVAEGETDPAAEGDAHAAGARQSPEQLPEFVKLTNQFVVPLVEKNQIASLVIISLSIEVTPGGTDQVYAKEPKLRDEILQRLFDHANTGGFRGTFTDADNLVILRNGLTEVARDVLGNIVKTVLITDIIRQDS